jgi:hypothetical protein
MPEWPKGHDWKSCVPQGTEGSNPSLSSVSARGESAVAGAGRGRRGALGGGRGGGDVPNRNAIPRQRASHTLGTRGRPSCRSGPTVHVDRQIHCEIDARARADCGLPACFSNQTLGKWIVPGAVNSVEAPLGG